MSAMPLERVCAPCDMFPSSRAPALGVEAFGEACQSFFGNLLIVFIGGRVWLDRVRATAVPSLFLLRCQGCGRSHICCDVR